MENFDKTQEDKLNQPRFQLTKNLSTGIWLPNINRVKITKSKGKFVHNMGYSSDYKMTNEQDKNQKPTYLYPEEALYQMENSNLLIYYKINDFEIPMSIQQCYENFFRFDTQLESDPSDQNTNIVSLDDYKVYSHLVRLGYILRRVTNASKQSNSKMNTDSSSSFQNVDFTQPLINRNDYSNLDTQDIFSKLNELIPSISIKDIQLDFDISSEFRLLFDVYLPDKSFRKSKPLKEPVYSISTSLSNQIARWPCLKEFILNNTNTSTNQTKHLYSFVDNGDVLFYSFDLDLKLPLVHSK